MNITARTKIAVVTVWRYLIGGFRVLSKHGHVISPKSVMSAKSNPSFKVAELCSRQALTTPKMFATRAVNSIVAQSKTFHAPA
jgi:hypothetical protein